MMAATNKQELISMNPSNKDAALIKAIMERIMQEWGEMIANKQLEDDIIMCHLNGTELDLQQLLELPKVQFGAEIGGIRSNLDRRCGQLSWGFVPKCVVKNNLKG